MRYWFQGHAYSAVLNYQICAGTYESSICHVFLLTFSFLFLVDFSLISSINVSGTQWWIFLCSYCTNAQVLLFVCHTVKERQVFDVGAYIQNSSKQLFEKREFISSSNPISQAVGLLGFSETISLFFIVTLKMGRQWWGPSLRFHKCCCFMSFNTSSKESTSNNFLSQLILCVCELLNCGDPFSLF